jgi:outer membrane protein OmpA-like peptidoglycan-associated protein/tetratricopeptide (TPR) repeat protein
MLIRLLLICLLFTGSAITLQSQGLPKGTYTSTNKKAVKAFEEAKKAFESGKGEEAEKNVQKALKEDPDFAEAHTMMAYIHRDAGRYDKAIESFEKSVQKSGAYFPLNYAELGELYYYGARYEEASKTFGRFLTFQRVNPDLKAKVEHFKICADFSIEAVKNPKPFKPINAGSAINTDADEYFPTVTADNGIFYFTRKYNVMNQCSGTKGQEDFFVTTRNEKNEWKSATPFREINSDCNEGAPCISANGQFMFYTACGDVNNNYGPTGEKGYGSCDLFYSDKINGKWSKPVNIGPPVNSKHWETQPSFSSDGKTLYFVRGLIGRDRKHTGDIYYSTIGADGKFGEPVKLGPNINTEGSEESVFIHPDNMTLYFSSTGRPGLGEYDIFMSKRQADGEWGPAVNLGYPINTNKSENSLLVDPTGKLAYFASNRDGGMGGLDIYYFDLPQEFQPEEITFAKGLVYDSLTKAPLRADFEMIDLETGKTVANSFSNATGNFLITITANKNYMVNVTKSGYLFYSEKFRMKEVKTDYNNPFVLNIPMLPLDTGKSMVLNNLYFDVDKAELRPESKSELEKLTQFLVNNPKISIEVSGHTDNAGDKKKNLLLSENRAKAVMDYLITNGKIDPKRLRSKGYGETRPRFPNDTEQHKQMNRRTEYKIISTKEGWLPPEPKKTTTRKPGQK